MCFLLVLSSWNFLVKFAERDFDCSAAVALDSLAKSQNLQASFITTRNRDVTGESSAFESMLIFHICCCLSIVQTLMLIKLSCFPAIFSSLHDMENRNSLKLPMANTNNAIASLINSDAVTRIIFRHKQKYLSSAERANLQCSG